MDLAKARQVAQRALDEHNASAEEAMAIVDEAIVPWDGTEGWCFPLHPAAKLAERNWTLAGYAPGLILVTEDDVIWLMS